MARAGIEKPFCHYFPTPILVGKLARKVVHQVSCGPNHSLALTDLEVFSWGSGDGGRLGLGDDRNRETPVSIDSLKGQIVLQISAGNWHSAAVVLIPPNIEAGYCYTWGSGHCGQLGQEEVTCSRKPALVHTLLDQHVTVILNGITIIDNQPLPGGTGGMLSADPSKPGPILLQGNHGPVSFRNIVLTPVIQK